MPSQLVIPSQGVFGLPSPKVLCAYGRAVVGTAGLQDVWPLDDTAAPARNLKGGQNIPTVTGTVTFRRATMLRNDPFGGAISVASGSLRNSSAYSMPAVGTMEVLALPYAIPAGSDTAIGNWNGSGVQLYWSSPITTIRFYLNGTSATYALAPEDLAFSPVHWALTWDGSTQRLYINGIQRATQSVGSPSTGTGIQIFDYSSAGHTGTGIAQWLAVYSRALSAAELLAHAALAHA